MDRSDSLIELKTLLRSAPTLQNTRTLEILDHVAERAESFSRLRHKTKKLDTQMTDALDREGKSRRFTGLCATFSDGGFPFQGVNLWNMSTPLKEDPEGRLLFASCSFNMNPYLG